MGTRTKIEWCDHTANFWRGCTKVSAGCAHCYAERQAKRNPKVFGVWGNQGTRVIAAEAYWRQPLAWNRQAEKDGVRRRVFCGSMMDVFEDRPELEAPRVRAFDLMLATPHLDWLLLTKRPENIPAIMELLPGRLISRKPNGDVWFKDDWPKNVWLGVSVENQEAAEKRIPPLLECQAAVRFLSLEPLLGPVQFPLPCKGSIFWSGIHWIIVGGESGPGARDMEVGWSRSVIQQCKAAGVPVFMKQMGSCPMEGKKPYMEMTVGAKSLNLKHSKGGDPLEWPEDLRIREWPE